MTFVLFARTVPGNWKVVTNVDFRPLDICKTRVVITPKRIDNGDSHKNSIMHCFSGDIDTDLPSASSISLNSHRDGQTNPQDIEGRQELSINANRPQAILAVLPYMQGGGRTSAGTAARVARTILLPLDTTAIRDKHSGDFTRGQPPNKWLEEPKVLTEHQNEVRRDDSFLPALNESHNKQQRHSSRQVSFRKQGDVRLRNKLLTLQGQNAFCLVCADTPGPIF